MDSLMTRPGHGSAPEVTAALAVHLPQHLLLIVLH